MTKENKQGWLQKFATTFRSVKGDIYEAGSNLVNNLTDNFAQRNLNAEVEKLMKTNFKNVDESECIELIEKIKNLAIEKELNFEYNHIETVAKTAAIKKGVSDDNNTGKKVMGFLKYSNREYRELSDGDPKKIFEVLKKHACKNDSGEINIKDLKGLQSDGLVMDFLSMIWEELTKFFGTEIEEKQISAGDKYIAGKFAEKVIKTKGDKVQAK